MDFRVVKEFLWLKLKYIMICILQIFTWHWPFPWRHECYQLPLPLAETKVSLLLSASFPSPAPQVLLLNLSKIGRACGTAGVSFRARKPDFIQTIGFHSTVSPDEVITYFFLIRIFSLHSIIYIYKRFLVFLNQCMMPSPQHTLFELPTHLVKLQFSL